MGLTFYLLTDKEVKVEQRRRENILIKRKQEKVLQIQIKVGETINSLTVEKSKPKKFAEIKVVKKDFEVGKGNENIEKEVRMEKNDQNNSCPSRSEQ
jgi:hypothetical protein